MGCGRNGYGEREEAGDKDDDKDDHIDRDRYGAPRRRLPHLDRRRRVRARNESVGPFPSPEGPAVNG